MKIVSILDRLKAAAVAFSNPSGDGGAAAPSGAVPTPTPNPEPAATPAAASGPWLDRARRGTIKGILILLAAVFLLWLGGKLLGGFLGFITLPLSWIDPLDPALSLLYLSNLNVVFSLLYPVLIALGIIYITGLIFEGRVVVFNDRDSTWPGLPYLTIFLVGGVKCAHTALADWGLWYTQPFVGLLCSILGFGLVGVFFVARARQARDPKLGFRPVAIARALVAGWYTSMCVLTAVALVGYGITATFQVPSKPAIPGTTGTYCILQWCHSGPSIGSGASWPIAGMASQMRGTITPSGIAVANYGSAVRYPPHHPLPHRPLRPRPRPKTSPANLPKPAKNTTTLILVNRRPLPKGSARQPIAMRPPTVYKPLSNLANPPLITERGFFIIR